MVLMGTDAAERDGIFWTVTHEDHPAKALFTRPRKVSLGTSTIVGIKKEKVKYLNCVIYRLEQLNALLCRPVNVG